VWFDRNVAWVLGIGMPMIGYLYILVGVTIWAVEGERRRAGRGGRDAS